MSRIGLSSLDSRIPSQILVELKFEIQHLYQAEKATAEKIKQIIEEKYQLPDISIKTYRWVIRDKLHLRKKLKKADWCAVYQKYLAKDNRDIQVYLNGVRVPPKTVEKEIARYKNQSTGNDQYTELSEGVVVETSPSAADAPSSRRLAVPKNLTQLLEAHQRTLEPTRPIDPIIYSIQQRMIAPWNIPHVASIIMYDEPNELYKLGHDIIEVNVSSFCYVEFTFGSNDRTFAMNCTSLMRHIVGIAKTKDYAEDFTPLMRLLRKPGAVIDSFILDLAIERGRKGDILNIVLNGGANIDEYPYRALFRAILYGNYRAVSWLLAAYVDIDIADLERGSPLSENPGLDRYVIELRRVLKNNPQDPEIFSFLNLFLGPLCENSRFISEFESSLTHAARFDRPPCIECPLKHCFDEALSRSSI
ncbi:hypothetical protein F4805DRAFT_436211 [Annulohypoxylon moriforme]|nr:hypothetical protein F4805DRAFT_436211 [Annulohypoxylon moriforme]